MVAVIIFVGKWSRKTSGRVHTLNDSRSSDGKMECRQKRQNSSASQLDLQKI